MTQPGVSLSGQGQGLARTVYDMPHGVQERSQGLCSRYWGDPMIATREVLQRMNAREMRTVLQEVSKTKRNEQKRVCTWKVGRNSSGSKGSKFYPT